MRYPSSILHSSIDSLLILLDLLDKLKANANDHSDKFNSEGFTTLFELLKYELNDNYFIKIQDYLQDLKFRDGILFSTELGMGNKGTSYMLCKQLQNRKSWKQRIPSIIENYFPFIGDSAQNWIQKIFDPANNKYTFYIHPRDNSGLKILSDLKDEGINSVANALAQSSNHIINFFTMLRTELAFYVGCLNLNEQLANLGESISFPNPVASQQKRHSFKGLYDICLALTLKQKIVGNDVQADDKNLVIITGANQGGKSTLLRSLGLSQMMMQCGMFVPADSFSANICDLLFTHFRKEEDSTMNSGKLDEELSRMSDIIDKITSKSMILFNESFSATNEREGSEIANQIVSALIEKQIKVFFVTHLYAFAHGFYNKKLENSLFLLAERQSDTKRTFRVIEGEPLQTSFGDDLYRKIFNDN